MDDRFAVRRIQRIRDLDSEVEEILGLRRLSPDPVPERLALQQFHDNERPAGFFNDVVDGADVGVVQRRRGPGLALESFERSLISKFIRHGFTGNYLLTREALLRRIIHKPASANPASAADPGSGVRKARISPPGFCVVWMLR